MSVAWRIVVSLAFTANMVAITGGLSRVEREITAVALLCSILLTPLAAFAVVSYLTAGQQRFPTPKETRCRKCDYILRGITEPRCPECGERI